MGQYNMILCLDTAGTPLRWMTWEDAVCYKVKNLVTWSMGNEETFVGGISRSSNLQSSVTVAHIIAIRNLSRHDVPKAVLLTNISLFGRDRRICAYCGEKVSLRYLTRDHIVPVSRGGKTDWTNCVTCCIKCNCKKGNKLLHEIAGMSLLYVPYVPSRAETLILNNSRILNDQMDYLKAKLPKNSRALLN